MRAPIAIFCKIQVLWVWPLFIVLILIVGIVGVAFIYCTYYSDCRYCGCVLYWPHLAHDGQLGCGVHADKCGVFWRTYRVSLLWKWKETDTHRQLVAMILMY